MDIEGDSVEAVRKKIAELEIADIARVGHADVLSFELHVREITQSTIPSGDDDEGGGDNKPRPSGWYRPA